MTMEDAGRARAADEPPIDGPMCGSAASDLIAPCPRPGPIPDRPDRPIVGPPLAVTFSGGGFRATLTSIGVGRFLAAAGLLGNVRYLSSVSGGSVANGLLALAWDGLAKAEFSREAYDEAVVAPLTELVTRRSLSSALIRNVWRILGPSTRTDLLARFFDEWFFDGRELEELPSDVRWVFNAANVTTGVRFGFERDVVGDYVLGLVTTAGTGLRVAQAAAASAAVPGAFAPFKIDLAFPCANGREAKLLDGGTYDNLGLEVVDDRPDVFLVAVNAGGIFRTGRYRGIPIVRDLVRSSSLLYRQTISLRHRDMVERFQAWERATRAGRAPPDWARRGVLFGLATTFDDRLSEEWAAHSPQPSRREIERLACVPTSFGRFEPELCRALIRRGWWLAGASIATYHTDLLDTLPLWTEIASLEGA